MAKQDRGLTSSKTKQMLRAAVHEVSTSTPNAVVKQVGGSHYERQGAVCPHCGGKVQHWDLFASEPYLEGYASKYLMRWREKGGIQDLDKAISIIQKIKAIELLRTKSKS